MPIIKSAIKRVRQETKRRSRNLAAKRRIKTATKQTQVAIAEKDLKAAHSELLTAISHIDKAIKKGTLHKNTGARRKSSLTRQYNLASDKAYGTESAPKAKAKTPVAKPVKKTAKPAAKATTAKKPAAVKK